jgi:trehalose 6-phosphate synthase
VNQRDGVLILAENAGAHAELGDWALSVNPFDVAGQAEAIDRALTMPLSERRDRLEAIRAQVREHDVTAWITEQLADLDRCAAAALR